MRCLIPLRTIFRLRSSTLLLGVCAWLVTPTVAQPPPDRFSRPVLVATQTDNFPHSYLNEEGEAEGFAVDLLDAIARVMDISIQRVLLPSQDMKADLIAGKVDVLQAYSFDPARETFAAFSTSFLEIQGGFFINKRNSDKIHSYQDLDGREIVVVGRQGPGDRFVRKNLVNAKVIYSEGGLDALRQIQSGEYEAAFLSRFTAFLITERFGLSDIVPLGPPLSEYPVRLCFAVRRDDSEVLNRLNEGLAILHRTGEFESIYKKWFGRVDRQGFSREQVVALTIALLIVALVIALWIGWRQRQLRNRIARQSEELAESRTLLAEAQAFAHLGHWRRTLDTPNIVTWSDETFRIHERDPALGPPTNFDELVVCASPADGARWRAAIDRAMRENYSYQLDLSIEPLPGLRKFIHVHGRSQVDKHGRVIAIFGTVQDITARRTAELARQESEQLLRALFDTLPNALGVLDHTNEGWQLVSLNPEAARLTGFANPAAVNDKTSQAKLNTHPWWRELLGRASEATQPVRFLFQRDDLRREFAATLVPLRTPEARPRCCFLIEDVTERNVRDAEISQGRRLRAIGEMVGGIAHEFNNLLTPILVTADALTSSSRHSPTLHADHKLIADTSRRAAELTRRLLTFERKADRKPEIVTLSTMVDANLDLLRHTADRRIRLFNTMETGLPPLYLNAGDLNQIVLNLLLNARDTLDEKLAASNNAAWTPAIIVNATCLPPAATTPQDSSSHPLPDHWLRLAITDNGQGMAKPIIERIFEPFYSTKQVGRGTGLGLATVWHLIADLGGRIEVESAEGTGTTFFVYLPVRPVLLAETPISPPAQSAAPGLRLLVAEDEEAIALVLRTLLKRDQHNATLTANGREAWEIFERQPGAFDVLLLDFNMPEVTGLELARRVRSAGYKGPILIMSGRITDEARNELLTVGVDTIVEKPFTLDSIRTALSRIRRDHPSGLNS
jgi:two-component system, cell cycle sensor histidine kinase and response regulator CckA